MSLHIFNSLSGQKEKFEPLDPQNVRIYNCGPTVYNLNHIGNFRAYMFVDVLRRYLKFRGFKLDHTTNITDVDDKIIRESLKNKQSIQEFTAPYIKAFLEDIALLKIEDVEHRPRATESLEDMFNMIKELEKQGHTYIMDGNVYFRIASFDKYGKLSRLDPGKLKTAADGRFEADEYTKEDARDFALWKAPGDDSEYAWDSPWGRGRPGWHLECSAMIRGRYGKDGVDIHTGGVDLLFPHHENELAQSQCAHPHDNFVRYWMHNEHLLVESKKMSKSLGNFFTLRDLTEPDLAKKLVAEKRAPDFILKLIEKGKMPRAIRYVLLSFHYRTKLNFTFDNIKNADVACERLQSTVHRLLDLAGVQGPEEAAKAAEKLIKQAALAPGEGGAELTALPGSAGHAMNLFLEAMDEDLNTARALAPIFDLTREVNQRLDRSELNASQALEYLALYYRLNQILDVLEFVPATKEAAAEKLDEETVAYLKEMIVKRAQARKDKDFAEADRLRDELKAKGFALVDTPEGTVWEEL